MKTVDFITAVNSGKRFKNCAGCSWVEVVGGEFSFVATGNRFIPNKFDVDSQYSLQEKTITLSESEFDKLWNNLIHDGRSMGLFHALKSELGFSDV